MRKQNERGPHPLTMSWRRTSPLMTFLDDMCWSLAFLSCSDLEYSWALDFVVHLPLTHCCSGLRFVDTLIPQIPFGQMPLVPRSNTVEGSVTGHPWTNSPDTFPRKTMDTAILHRKGTKFTVLGCLHVIKSKGKFVQKRSLFLRAFWQIPFYLFFFFSKNLY